MNDIAYRNTNKEKINCVVTDPVTMPDDGGNIPITFYYDACKASVDTEFVLYAIGTDRERISTETDENIILKFVSEGYGVCVADCSKMSSTSGSLLDWSLQSIVGKLCRGELFSEDMPFNSGKTYTAFLVPAGYYLSRNHVFWSFDKHSADGTLDEIVNVWNNDFRSSMGESVVCWVDDNGKRKSVQDAFDGSAPIWLDSDGNHNPEGKYIRIKHTKALDVCDCIKPDDDMISLDLEMNIYSPGKPKRRVPVMCLSNSTTSIEECPLTEDRPHFHGFLMRGYAGVVYDYGYAPMARGDHWGYFDGDLPKGVTGDQVTYSMQFYNNVFIATAAMRYVRYLSLTDKRFDFDIDAIGVMGNSKGGWTAFLGRPEPLNYSLHRYIKNHHGETRYDVGKKDAAGAVRGGEEQPYKMYEGKEISSQANFVFPSCGGHPADVTSGHSPMFVPCHYKDRSGYVEMSDFVNLCREHDVPALETTLVLGHTQCYGKDTRYGFESYDVLFDFAGFFLKDEGAKALYCTADENGVHIKFTGVLSQIEAEEIKLICHSEQVGAQAKASFGGTMWTFVPEKSGRITVIIPEKYCGAYIASTDELTFDYVGKKTIEAEYELVFEGTLSELDTTCGELLEMSDIIAPDGKKAAEVVVRLNDNEYFNRQFYSNHFVLGNENASIITVNNLAQSCGVYRLHITVRDAFSRDIQLRIPSMGDREREFFDFNRAIKNYTTKKDEQCELTFDFAIENPEIQNQLQIAVASAGNTGAPVCFEDIKIYKLV